MPPLRRLVLVRHGETSGNSSERLIGSGDPELSAEGRAQIHALRERLRGQVIDRIVASPLRRAWQSAEILAGGAPIRLERDLREIDFGHWEGRTLDEIELSDPVLFARWREGAAGFEYPGGESRAAFRSRVERALERLLAEPGTSALVVAHKGVLRALYAKIVEGTLDREQPGLGGCLILTRVPGRGWFEGQRGSDPPGLSASTA
jgi:broad specificity phosphatase PhoE